MKYLLVAMLALTMFACKQDQPHPEGCEEALLNTNRYANDESDDFQFHRVELNGDCLEIEVSYGGGCGEVDFDLVFSRAVGFSLPPYTTARLILDDDDNCEALLRETFQFDLTPARELGADAIRINLQDWDEEVLYEF